MKNFWTLPESMEISGKRYAVNWDFRQVLPIFSCLTDPDVPEAFRWRVALGLFYREEIPPESRQEAIEALAAFLRGGEAPREYAGPRLYDWRQDAPVILAEVNKVAGRELRREKAVHWWTFLGWFHGIGQGRFSLIVGIRDKLRRGEKLTAGEERFCRENRELVALPDRCSARERKQKEALLRLLEAEG